LKKNELRFTVCFNPADPRHIKAAQILNNAGRRKATIVANALWEYAREHEEHESAAIHNIISDYQQPSTSKKALGQSDNDKTDAGFQNAVIAGLNQFRDND